MCSSDLLIPFRVAIALQEDGWWIRSVIIWNKLNPMPESVKDRPTNSYEFILMLTKSGSSLFWTHPHKRGMRTRPKPDYIWKHKKTGLEVDYSPVSARLIKTFWTRRNLWQGHDYYWDADAVMEKYTEPLNRWGGDSLKRDTSKTAAYKEMQNIGYSSAFRVGRPMRPNENGRNLRDVWTFPTTPFPSQFVNGEKLDHFAVFPEKLPELCIKAATSEKGCCPKCGAPWVRVIDRDEYQKHESEYQSKEVRGINADRSKHSPPVDTKTIGWKPTCNCGLDPIPCTVLDPFAGSGTTLLQAKKLGRKAIGYDISKSYCTMTVNRTSSLMI